jgi:TamB, inner membrane protein subunit of TAM complex
MLSLAIIFSLPFVQSKLAAYAMKSLNEKYKTHISIDQVAISVFGTVKFKKVLILDHHKDTLIFAKRINTNILSAKKLIAGDLIFGTIRLDGLVFNLKTYKGENQSNINVFVDAFGKSKPTKDHFLLKTGHTYVRDGRFILTNENHKYAKSLDLKELQIDLKHLKIYGAEVVAQIEKMAFHDFRGLSVTQMAANYFYSKKGMTISNLVFETPKSKLQGFINMKYNIEDLADFENKVQLDAQFTDSKIATNDIRFFYDDLGKDQLFSLNTKLKGTLNNLYLKKMRLYKNQNFKITGDFYFKNILGNANQKFFMQTNLKNLSTDYENLVAILPSILEKNIPISLKKLGRINATGAFSVTATTLNGNLIANTGLGKLRSNFNMKNIHQNDKATYNGLVVLDDFDIGTFAARKELKNVSLNLIVDGKGFKQSFLDTNLKGIVSKLDYNGYNYSNIAVAGNFATPVFKGQIEVNDPNLKMDFDGLVDFSQQLNQFDFHVNVAHADLHKLQFVKDNIALFKGNVQVQASGNSIENMRGTIFIKKTAYQNSKDNYVFEDFTINSSFDNNQIRTITLDSPDIIKGKIVGKFQFKDLKKLIENSLGSLYANYRANAIGKGQFLNFDFAIYNKIIELFYPKVSIAPNTVIRGDINGDKNDFKLYFNSPKISVSSNTFDNIRLNIDNKNKLYNAFIEVDSINTKSYKASDFSLVNVTKNDTLFFRTEFKGGKLAKDFYNLNLYHTIDKNKQNVVGIRKSEVKFKNKIWTINPKEEADENQIVFDKLLKNFTINNILLSHVDQKMLLFGSFDSQNKKDLEIDFSNVDLNEITPASESFVFDGNINGKFIYKQEGKSIQPTASLAVENFKINKTDLGKLDVDIEGDNSLKKFVVASKLDYQNEKPFELNGDFEILNDETILNLNLDFDKFSLKTLSAIGGEVISNIRGNASGSARIEGNASNPQINGRLYLDQVGLAIPYLGIDFKLADQSIVDLTDTKFLFRNNILTDVKYNTKGILDGIIEHQNFSNWKLDLNLSSDRLLALDTKDRDDAAYFGTAFIDGKASIKGPIKSLMVKVDAKSKKGTEVKIPINDAESVAENGFIHFLTPKEKTNIQQGIAEKIRDYNGLELEFNFDITPDAEVEVILDRQSGHGMKGRGNGSLLFKINTQGKFNMWGDFLPYEGTYNFRYNLIDKKFEVKKGGSIEWFGDPMKAVLNLEAVYKTIANPSVLLANPSFNNKVPVEVIIGLKGNLSNPDPSFSIDFPTVSNVLKSEIQYKLSDKDIKQTQAIYLLSSGGFLSSEGASQSDLYGGLLESATGLLESIIPTNSNKLKFDFNLTAKDNRLGKETNGRFQTSVSGKINEKLLVNGKFGVPFGSIKEDKIISNVELQYSVNQDRTLNLKLFNKENEIKYVGEGTGYTQGFGISYEVNFNSFEELANRVFRRKKETKTEFTPAATDEDSEIPTKKSLPKEETPKKNQEAIIPEEL